MRVIRGFNNLPKEFSGCVATIGNFDSVHLGHQAIISRLIQVARQRKLSSLLMIFEPQPEEYFDRSHLPARLTRLREKLQVLKNFNLDFVLIVPFHETLAHLSAEGFVENYLVKQLRIAQLVMGDDFHVGKHRKGDVAFLKKMGEQYQFSLEVCPPITLDNGVRVSSTAVRAALEKNNLILAQDLLGRPYSMCGRVAHGDKRGRILGFPTANIYLHRKKSPMSGVYVVSMHGVDNKPVWGVANVGIRPTVKGKFPLLEAHLFNFDQDIYGRYVRVEFLHKLREEQRFHSFDALKAQILKDSAAAQKILKEKYDA